MTSRQTLRAVQTMMVLAVAMLGFAVGYTVAYRGQPAPSPKLHDYCSAVSVALAMDADDLANGTEKRQLAAAARFGELVTFHSKYEISLCAKRPVDLEQQSVCSIGRNYPCLAKMARDASEATKP